MSEDRASDARCVVPAASEDVQPRLLVVGSSMGAGHMTAAEVLANHAAQRGAAVRVVDYLELSRGPQGRATRRLYREMVARTPLVYGAIMRGWQRHPAVFERLSAIGRGGFERGLQREVEQFTPTVVIATYNLAGQMLGRLRARGRLDVPALVYVTDAGAHPYWVARGADLHLAPLPVTAAALRSLGADNVRLVEPLVRPPAAVSRDAARAALGVRPSVRVALVNGGSWGVGPVVDSARALVASGMAVYVLCGHSDALHRAVSKLEGAVPIGWTSDVATWIAAADVVVDSAGGTTCWEAIIAGRPVVLHRPLAGHGRLNAAALASAGLVTVTETPQALETAVREATSTHQQGLPHCADATDLVLAAA